MHKILPLAESLQILLILCLYLPITLCQDRYLGDLPINCPGVDCRVGIVYTRDYFGNTSLSNPKSCILFQGKSARSICESGYVDSYDGGINGRTFYKSCQIDFTYHLQIWANLKNLMSAVFIKDITNLIECNNTTYYQLLIMGDVSFSTNQVNSSDVMKISHYLETKGFKNQSFISNDIPIHIPTHINPLLVHSSSTGTIVNVIQKDQYSSAFTLKQNYIYLFLIIGILVYRFH